MSPTPELTLQGLIIGDWIAQAVQVAAKLRLADELGDSTRTAAELAEAVGAHPDSLRRLLLALASVGVLEEAEAGEFRLSPVGQFLRSDVPGSMRALAAIHTDIEWAAWGKLEHSVRTGENAFRHVHGMGYFDYLRTRPEAGRLFDEGMTEYFTMRAMAVAACFDFSPYRTVIDVGGGRGALMEHVLRAYQGIEGIIFDLPEVVNGVVPPEGCRMAGGNFFEAVPEGGDVYVVASILHDWDDEQCVKILRNCRRAMQPGARLLVIEMAVPETNAPAFVRLLDLEMLVCFGGRERTAAEYGRLLAGAGFDMVRVIPTGSPTSILEAV